MNSVAFPGLSLLAFWILCPIAFIRLSNISSSESVNFYVKLKPKSSIVDPLLIVILLTKYGQNQNTHPEI